MCGKYYVVRYGSNLTDRITPACAGNTRLAIAFEGNHVGSPPHVREIQYRDAIANDPTRITPACAGNTHIQRGRNFAM